MLVETKNEREENLIAMNKPRCDAVDCIQFLVAAQRVFTSPKLLAANRREKTHPFMTPLLASCSDSLPTRRRCGGKHQKVVRGINLLKQLWTYGKARIPCDFQVYDNPIGGKRKNEQFLAMLHKARYRGFEHHMRSLIVNLTLLFPVDTFAHS